MHHAPSCTLARVGWLRDLIETSDLQVKSLGHVAQLALNQADWPSDVRIQPRSLAALLGKIDRGQEVGWLASRSPVQLALARALGIGVDAVTRGLRSADPAALAEGRLLRLRDLPAARPFDLWNEPLPPPLPALVFSTDSPPLWWQAPSGAGRSLLGAWLQARGRARFVVAAGDEWNDPDDGACVYVEFEESTPASTVIAPRPGLVVAAPFPPAPGFRTIQAPDLLGSVEALVRWAIERLPSDTALNFERVAPWLAEQVRRGDVTTLGAALGLLGLADERGSKVVEARSLERLAQQHVEERLVNALDPTLSQTSWLRRNGFDALVGLMERALVDSEHHPAAARTTDDWLALVPRELERTVDVDWMRLSLRHVDSGVRPSELERAARRLPPGAYRLVSALEQAGFLRRRTDASLKLGPSWLAELLERKAYVSLAARSPLEWGEALLRPHAAARLADVLFERALKSGTSFLEPVLDLQPGDEPQYAITLDLSLRLAGIARLMGADVSQETMDGVWSEVATTFVELDGEAPRPLLEPTVLSTETQSVLAGRQLLARGTALIAALSISETIGRAPGPAVLCPWNQTEPPPGAVHLYDTIAESLRSRPPWFTPTLRMIGRLRAIVGNVSGADEPHELEWPAQFVEEVEHGVLTSSAFQRALPALDAVQALALARGLAAEKIADALWSAWFETAEPERTPPFVEQGQWADYVLTQTAPSWAERWAMLGSIPDHAFARFRADALQAVARLPGMAARGPALSALPPETLDAIAHSSAKREEMAAQLEVLWARAPSAAGAAISEECRGSASARPTVLASLLERTAEPFVARAVAALSRDDRVFLLERPALDVVRRALQRWASSRGSGWREAFALLRRIEREHRRR